MKKTKKEPRMKLIIYGAQAIALGTYRAIKTLFQDIDIPLFLVKERGINPDVLAGIPVMELSEVAKSARYRDTEILICTPENIMDEIESDLDERELYNHVRMTSARFTELMSFSFSKSGAFRPLAQYPIGKWMTDITVYVAKHHRDRELKEAVTYPDYFTPIQVGAALTDIRVSDVTDDEGDNISKRNVNYSELSGLYWIWKNVLEKGCEKDYIGLAHYRRFLSISQDDILRLKSNDIDVVLPYPMPYEPNIEEHHKRYLKEDDWNGLLKAFREIHPEEITMMEKVLSQEYMCNYNIILAKAEVLKGYCEWLFPVLLRTEELSIPKGSERSDRYIGYIGETLLTVYFMSRRDTLKIAYTGCEFGV